MEKINYRDVGFQFEKIGRALNAEYYYYNQAVLVKDDKGFVFQKTSTKDWYSLGQNGERVFNEYLRNNEFKHIDFSEPVVVHIEYCTSFLPPNKMYIYYSNKQKVCVLDDGNNLATAIHAIMCYNRYAKDISNEKLKAIECLVGDLPRTNIAQFEIDAIKKLGKYE